MATQVLTPEALALRLDAHSLGLTDEQFFRLCQDNRDLRFEMTARGELVIMAPAGSETGRRNARINHWNVRNRQGMNRLRSGHTPRQPKSYSRDVPGERVQMDTVKIGPGLFQFTAVDDCTRMRVIALYPRRTAQNAVRFLQEHVLEEFSFPIQRIQTERCFA